MEAEDEERKEKWGVGMGVVERVEGGVEVASVVTNAVEVREGEEESARRRWWWGSRNPGAGVSENPAGLLEPCPLLRYPLRAR